MLEYYYRWLIHTSACPSDKYHRAWKLIEQYWEDNPSQPFSTNEYINWLEDSATETRNLIKAFFSKTHYMAFLENRWVLMDLVDFIHIKAKVAIVKFNWDTMHVVEWMDD